MRTTVTLDSDTEHLVRQRMDEQGVSFKRAINDAIREGAARRPAPRKFATRTASLGTPTVNLDHALQIAGDIEDEELVRRMRKGA